MSDLLSKFAETNDGADVSKDNKFDEAMAEMLLTFNEHGGSNNIDSTRRMVEGWVDMETNKFSTEMLAEEVKELLTVEALCGLTNPDSVEVDENDAGEESEGEDVSEMRVTEKDIDELTTKLKTIAVSVDQLPPTYASIAQEINDSSERLRSFFRREETKKKTAKAKNSWQANMQAFFK